MTRCSNLMIFNVIYTLSLPFSDLGERPKIELFFHVASRRGSICGKHVLFRQSLGTRAMLQRGGGEMYLTQSKLQDSLEELWGILGNLGLGQVLVPPSSYLLTPESNG